MSGTSTSLLLDRHLPSSRPGPKNFAILEYLGVNRYLLPRARGLSFRLLYNYSSRAPVFSSDYGFGAPKKDDYQEFDSDNRLFGGPAGKMSDR